MNERNQKGQFIAGNQISRLGGHARAAALPAERRSEIASQGRTAMVAKWFGGNRQKENQWFTQRGRYATDRQYPQWMRVFWSPGLHPGTLAAIEQEIGDINFYPPSEVR